MAQVRIDEFTDPGCPFAWSAEPFRRRIDWLYGEHVGWRLHLVGLSERPEDYLEKGFTPERMAKSMGDIAREHHMPIATHERPRMAATVPACRAIVAAREQVGEPQARRLLRELRVRHFAGALLDDPQTIADAARGAGIAPDALTSWTDRPETEAALRADMAAARRPSPAAEALAHKLAPWEDGLRYTCPSYEMERTGDGERFSAPGFQPMAVYEAALANLLPDVERRPEPESVHDVLAWAGEPLATQEVAVVCGISLEEAREALGAVAVETHLGFDGLWSLPRYARPSMAASSDRASAATASASASSAGA